MKPVSSSRGATFLWLVFLICSPLTLAFQRPTHRWAAPQGSASITSSVASSTQSANIDATTGGNASNQTTVNSSGGGGGAGPGLPMVNIPLFLPSISGCTLGDTSTVAFTSEFPRYTGFESIEEGQEFWNDTDTVWVIQVVSPGFWVQDLGIVNENNSEPEDSSAISLGPGSTVIALTVPTHACISKHLVSPYQYKQLASLTHSACSCQSRDLRSVGLLNPPKRHQPLNQPTRSAFRANILALQIRF